MPRQPTEAALSYRVSVQGTSQRDAIESAALAIRPPNVNDAGAIWQLVRDSESLDANSRYAYLLLCSHFANTCRVAHQGERMLGFVAGYVRPDRRDALFVWQIGVDPEARGQGLASRLLDDLVERSLDDGVRFVEATATPGNIASQRLFHSLGERRGCQVATSGGYASDLFHGGDHDEELLIRVGPL